MFSSLFRHGTIYRQAVHCCSYIYAKANARFKALWHYFRLTVPLLEFAGGAGGMGVEMFLFAKPAALVQGLDDATPVKNSVREVTRSRS